MLPGPIHGEHAGIDPYTRDKDTRVTRVGRLLRLIRLDELP